MLVVVLVLLAAFPLDPAEAQTSGRAVWWGPTGMLDGWHVRVPLAVQNPLGHSVWDTSAGHDLFLRDALLQSGWTSSRDGQLQSFELDENSVRVVEYRALGTDLPYDGLVVGEVPARARMGLLDGAGSFHNRSSPDVHVEWAIPGEFKAGGTRYFMVYVDSKTNGRKAAAEYPEPAMAPVEARYWMGRGTTLYGVAADLLLVGLEDGTSARVEAYQFGRPFLVESGAGGSFKNPVAIKRGEHLRIVLSDEPTIVRVTSNHPVLAYGRTRALEEFRGVIPSFDEGLLGKQFVFDSGPLGFMVVAPVGSATVTIDAPSDTSSQRVVSTTQLSPTNPSSTVDTTSRQGLYRVTSTEPVFVFPWPDAKGKVQYPSIHGAPVGSRILALAYRGGECHVSQYEPCDEGSRVRIPCTPLKLRPGNGELVAYSFGETVHFRGRALASGDLRLPIPVLAGRTPDSASAPPGTMVRLPTRANDGGGSCPTLVHTTEGPDDTRVADKGVLAVLAGLPYHGTTDILATPMGGLGATQFQLAWDASVVAYHNGTQLEVIQDGRVIARPGLGSGNVYDVKASASQPVEVVATKPVAVLPLQPGAFFSGLDRSPVVTSVGEPDYRGFLVSLAPAGGASEPLVGYAGPGKPVTYKLSVKNLAKDHRGEGVVDTVRLGLGGAIPEGWSASLSESLVRLDGGASRDVTLVVTPSSDAQEGAQMRLEVVASSEGNPAAVDRLSVATLVRASYEVDVWFDRENGARTRTVTLDPGSTQTLRVVVKNLAAVADRILVRATPLSPEWSASLDETVTGLREISLDPGEAREISLRITAPEVNASQSVLEVSAVSVSDASASAKISANVRVRADVRIALDVDNSTVEVAPGGDARFRVTFHNRGNDRVGIRFNTSGILPDGWPPPIVRQGQYVVDEISGIMPGTSVPLDVTVSVPENASRSDRVALQFVLDTLPQFLGDPIVRERLDLLVLVGAHHDLIAVDPPAVVPLGPDGGLRVRLTFDNGGNGDEALRVVPRSLPPGTTVLLDPPSRVLRGERGGIDFRAGLPTSTPAGVYPIAVEVVADDGYAFPLDFGVSVPEIRAASLAPLSPTRGTAGLVETVSVDVRNEGNVDLPMPPDLVVPEGWRYRWIESGGDLPPLASRPLTLEVQAPANAASGAYVIEADPSWATTLPLRWDLQTVRLDTEIVSAGASGGAVTVRVRNEGTGDASEVTVALVQGGEVVDRAVLRRVAPGGDGLATLSAARSGPMSVLVDSEGRYSEPSELHLEDSATVPRGVPMGSSGVFTSITFLAAALSGLLLNPRRLEGGSRR